MLYELRQYDIDPEKWEEYLVWAQTRAFPVLFEQFGFRLVGFWENVAKAGGVAPYTNLVWILAWESEEEMRERWAAIGASPVWKAVVAEVVDPVSGERKYHRRIGSTLLRSVPITAGLETLLSQ